MRKLRKILIHTIPFLLAISICVIARPVTAYAAYGKIAFSAGDGTGTMPTVTITSGTKYTVPECTFTYYGHTFTGWLGTNGTTYQPGQQITVSTTGTETLGLTAQWEEDETPTSGIMNNPDGSYDFYLKAGDTLNITDLPAGTAYQIYEETPEGWVLTDQSNSSGTIESLQTSEAGFTNNYQPGVATVQFSGTKKMDGKAAAAGAFSFTLYEGNTAIQTVSTLDGGFIQFDVIEYQAADAGRHTYTIKENNPNDSTIDYDTHTETIYVDVVNEGNNRVSATVTYDQDGIVFNNKSRPGVLKITKIANGLTEENKDDVFTFKITFTNENGQPIGDGEEIFWYYEGDSRLTRAAKYSAYKAKQWWGDFTTWLDDTFVEPFRSHEEIPEEDSFFVEEPVPAEAEESFFVDETDGE